MQASAPHETVLARVRRQVVAVRAIVARHGGANPRLFGSVARGDDHAVSDIDILVDNVHLTLFTLVDMEDELAQLLDADVDVVIDAEIPAKVRPRILAEAVAL